jgi:[ribosomal protein S5]-alanine N-acetyltransferase
VQADFAGALHNQHLAFCLYPTMSMYIAIMITSRLSLTDLKESDSEFIFELVNTPDWIKFIGDRNVSSIPDAAAYIRRIQSSKNVTYWVVRLRSGDDPIGIITWIKRDYLEHPDIGFAFLSEFTGNGYACEATSAVLNELLKDENYPTVLATTVATNMKSIRLLEKFNFTFSKKIDVKNESILVYRAERDQILITL